MNGRVFCPQQTLSEDDVKAHLKCEVLESQRKELVRFLIPDRHMDFLRSKYMLSEEDCEEINYPPTRQKKASKFLDILGKKGAEAYDALCESLKEEGTQTFLLRQLHEDFEKRLCRYRELVGHNFTPMLSITPPPIKPPPPPFPHRHSCIQAPVEHSTSGGSPVPLSPSSSCPGYASTISSTCPGYTSTMSSTCPGYASTISPSTCWPEEGGEKEGVCLGGGASSDADSKQHIVTEYLQSLTIREEGMAEGVMSSGPFSGSSSMQVMCSTLSPGAGFSSSRTSSGRPLSSDGQSISSETLTSWSLSQSSSPTSSDQPPFSQSRLSAAGVRPTAVGIPAQDSSEASGDHTINRQRCHQRLSSRGSLPELILSPDLQTGISPPSFCVPSADKQQPVEHEEVFKETSEQKAVEHEETSAEEHDDVDPENSPEESCSFFESLDNQSMVQVPAGAICRKGENILCQSAVRDQEKALGKCLCSDEELKEREEECSSKDGDVSLASKHSLPHNEGNDQLSYFSAAHSTERKTVDFSLSTYTTDAALSLSAQNKDTCRANTAPTKENGTHSLSQQDSDASDMASKENTSNTSLSLKNGPCLIHTEKDTAAVRDSSCICSKSSTANSDKISDENGDSCLKEEERTCDTVASDKKAFEVLQGMSRENRPSKHEASGYGPHSSKC